MGRKEYEREKKLEGGGRKDGKGGKEKERIEGKGARDKRWRT